MHIRKVKIGIIGLGEHFFKNIFPMLYKKNNYTIIGAYSPSKTKLKTFKGIKIYNNLDTLIQDKNINDFYVSADTSVHYKICLKIIKNYKNVICEKPLSINLKQFSRLISIAKKNNVLLFEAFMFQYHKNFKEIKKIYIDKYYGKNKSINIKFTIPKLRKNNFRYSKTKGGGAYFDLCCYLVKILSLLEKSDPIKIIGYKIYQDKNIDLSGVATLLFKNDLNFIFEWGFDRAYSNELSIKTSKFNIYANKVFSKKHNETTQIVCKSNNKVINKKISADNHFDNMFDYFIYLKKNKIKRKKYFIELIRYQKLYFRIENNLVKCTEKY